MLQTVDAARYAALGEAQRVRAVVLPAERGTIFDRNGAELALTVPKKTVWADPRLVADPGKAASLLAPILGADAAALATRLSRPADFVYVARQIDDTEAERIAGLHLSGVFLIDEPGRESPSGELARSIVGRVDIDNKGVSGVEGEYDERLAGVPGQLVREQRRPGSHDPGWTAEHRARDAGRRRGAHDRPVAPVRHRAGPAATGDRSRRRRGAPRSSRIRAPATCSRWRMSTSTPRRGSRSCRAAQRGVDRGVRAGLGEQGHHERPRAIEEGLVNPDTVLQVPDHLQVSDHLFSDHDPHPVDELVGQRHRHPLVEHRHDHDRPDARQAAHRRVPPEVRARGQDRARTSLVSRRVSCSTRRTGRERRSARIPIGQGISVTAMQMLEVYDVDRQRRRVRRAPPRRRHDRRHGRAT